MTLPQKVKWTTDDIASAPFFCPAAGGVRFSTNESSRHSLCDDIKMVAMKQRIAVYSNCFFQFLEKSICTINVGQFSLFNILYPPRKGFNFFAGFWLFL